MGVPAGRTALPRDVVELSTKASATFNSLVVLLVVEGLGDLQALAAAAAFDEADLAAAEDGHFWAAAASAAVLSPGTSARANRAPASPNEGAARSTRPCPGRTLC